MNKLLLILLLLPLFSFSQVQIGQDIDGSFYEAQCGRSVSLSSDGSIIAVGEPVAFDDSGRVRIFTFDGSWTLIGSQIIGETEPNLSGWSVSLSSDGTVVAIGGPANSNSNGEYAGHVRVFENIGGSWIKIGDDIDGEAADDSFGWSVSLSSDGTVVAIGGYLNDGNGGTSGHVRVFENIGGSWIQIGDDIDGESAGYRSGISVSLSSDGGIVAIGAIGGGVSSSGQVRIFENTGSAWTQLGQDINGESSGDDFGYSVSLSSDGSIVAIGDMINSGNGSESGHVRVFRNEMDNWVQIGSDIDGENANDWSGNSVSLSSDGDVVVIGAWKNNGNGSDSGHARIYKNEMDNWVQIGSDINGENAGDWSGSSVSISSDASTVAIGAIRNSDVAEESGHVRVFDISTLLSVEETTQLSFEIFPNPAKNQFTIQLQNDQDLEQVNIFNNLGQLIKTSNTYIINTSSLATGLYFVEIISNRGKATKKLVIE